MPPMPSARAATSLKDEINVFDLNVTCGFSAGFDFAVFFKNESASYFWDYVFEFIYDCLQRDLSWLESLFGHAILAV